MRIEVDTVLDIAKSMSVKREKQADDTEALIVHLKFGGMKVMRHVVDELLGKFEGDITRALYDELGAPIAPMVLGLPMLKLEFTGVVRFGSDGIVDALQITQGTLSGVEIALADKGALIFGEITWKAAGDETNDAEELLGRTCAVKAVLFDGGQDDLFRSKAA